MSISKGFFDYVELKDVPYELDFIYAFRDTKDEFENDMIYVYEHKKTDTHYLFISICSILDIAKVSGENQKTQIKTFVDFVLLKPEKVNLIKFYTHCIIQNFKKGLAVKLIKGKNIYIQMITPKGRNRIKKIKELNQKQRVTLMDCFPAQYHLSTIKHPDTIFRLLKMERGEKYCT